MKELKVDVAIIGSGTAGIRAHKGAKKQGASVVMIEGDQYGTTCARVGCMPSKLLIAAAEAAHGAHNASDLGIHANDIQINGKEVMQRVRDIRDRLTGHTVKQTLSIPEEERLMGWAHFEDDNSLLVGDHTRVKAKSIVIASGSRPMILPLFDGLEDKLIVNDDIFSWQDLPESVVVFGPGVIGLELGQALHRLGVRVRMFGVQSLLGPLSDPEIKAKAEEIFTAEFPLDTDSKVESVSRDGDNVVVRFYDRNSDGTRQTKISEERFDFCLAATGRVPNVEKLKLENTSLTLDTKGVPLFNNKTMQCGSSSIFIAGDANNELPLQHEASGEGMIAGSNAARFPNVQEGKRYTPLSVVFTEPQIAMVGKSWHQLEDEKKADPTKDYATGKINFAHVVRARVMNDAHGLMQVYASVADEKFQGAEIFGPKAEHFAHLLAWCKEEGLTIQEMLDRPYYHPVYEEGLRSALQLLQKALNKKKEGA